MQGPAVFFDAQIKSFGVPASKQDRRGPIAQHENMMFMDSVSTREHTDDAMGQF